MEQVEVVLVHPQKLTSELPLMIFIELQQPDLLVSEDSGASIRGTIENARAVANKKIEKLSKKILNEEVIPNAKSLILGEIGVI
ncbi:MAG: hypothetical protein V7756_15935 [Halopseudomonas sp.]|uniref:hypothetical protein n=1 Tax=Halopseudomonas sp. TaxID=2901191 RepID=UPI003001F54F